VEGVTDTLYFNGVNVATGDYATQPLTLVEISRIVREGRKVPEEHQRDLKRKVDNAAPSFAPLPGVTIGDLAQTGWGVIFAQGADPAVKEALAPLLKLREKQAKQYFRVLDGVEAYRTGESKNDFLIRMPHSVGGGLGVGPGPVNPKRLPYYLLIVGDPQAVPYRFQYELDVDFAVGRLSFQTPQEYADYANAVVEAESGPPVPRKVVFFGTKNRNDLATSLSAAHLIEPLSRQFVEDSPAWASETIVGANATKAKLSEVLGGERTPSLLFTATHGAVLPCDDPDQVRHQGALICQDWPGPILGRGRVPEKHFFSRDDLSSSAKVKGLLAFCFACYGAGTPQLDNFGHADGIRNQLAPHDLVSALPRRLLGLGALAVVGHIDRAFTYSFQWPRAGEQLDVYHSTLAQLLAGFPVGAALEMLTLFYASIATTLNNELEDLRFGGAPNYADLAWLWTANNDARNFIVLGDPAVRLNVSPE
jgi:hypothetical protein